MRTLQPYKQAAWPLARMACLFACFCACLLGAALCQSPAACAAAQEHTAGTQTADARADTDAYTGSDAHNNDGAITLSISATPTEQALTPPGRPSDAQTPRAGAAFSFGSYLRALGVLFLAVAVLWFILRLVRRHAKSFSHVRAGLDRSLLRMEAQLPLGQRRGLIVIRFEGQRLLLGVTEHSITRLAAEIPDDDPTADTTNDQNSPFAAIMNAFGRNKNTTAEKNRHDEDGEAHV